VVDSYESLILTPGPHVSKLLLDRHMQLASANSAIIIIEQAATAAVTILDWSVLPCAILELGLPPSFIQAAPADLASRLQCLRMLRCHAAAAAISGEALAKQ
jgi:hypothetical protein